jgi:SAM-dependent methyltransferase
MAEKINSFYDKMSTTYDKWMETGESTLEDELSLVLKTFPNPCRILDVGCGTGRISLPLQELGYNIVGVDISQGMINQARSKGLAESYVSDFASFQYDQNSFDGVISLHAGFSYTQDNRIMERMIQKCHGLLVREGIVLWDSPNSEFYGSERKLEWPTDNETVETICYGHDIKELIELFEKSGFEIQNVWGSYTPLKKYEKGLARLIIDAKNNEK